MSGLVHVETTDLEVRLKQITAQAVEKAPALSALLREYGLLRKEAQLIIEELARRGVKFENV